ncbi:MAG TPA: hypothetical protein VMG12_18520, partial [Polyangiaceae bacterium]|nr:hypothetical protein [Polyangiaceae bacterium]
MFPGNAVMATMVAALFSVREKSYESITRRALLLLDNPIQNYAWGSRTSLAKLLGHPPAAQPE